MDIEKKKAYQKRYYEENKDKLSQKRKENSRKTHEKRPHINQKVPTNQQYKIYIEYSKGNVSYAKLGRKYGLTRQRIQQIIKKINKNPALQKRGALDFAKAIINMKSATWNILGIIPFKTKE